MYFVVQGGFTFLSGLVSPQASYEPGQVMVSTGRYIGGTGSNTTGSGYIRLNANPKDGTTPFIDFVERTGSGVYDVKLRARLGDLSNEFGGNQEDVNNLNTQKNHLISEKKIIEAKYEKLLSAHRVIQERLGSLSKKLEQKFNRENKFDQKVDELNQETDLLISEIDKWEM